jgi:hypothetical protein
MTESHLLQPPRSAFSLPHVVDVKWRIDFTTKTSQLERVNEPSYTITFLTEVRRRGGGPGDCKSHVSSNSPSI